MAGEQILLDPTAESTGTQLDITDATLGYYLLEHDYPTPDNDEVWSYNTDTEGEQRSNTRPKNRVITAKVRCIQPNSGTPSIGTIVSKLQAKIAKLNREFGTYKRVLPSGDTIVFDVRAATIKVPSDKKWITAKKADVDLTFTCRPYGRGAPVTLGTHTATAKAPLVFTETGLKGDVPAEGTLRLTAVSNTKSWGIWGVQSRYYDSASTAALFYEAESGSAIFGAPDPGPAGASGSGTNKTIKHASVGLTRATSFRIQAANTMTHVGTFRVFARAYAPSTNTGVVYAQLDYSPATLTSSFNDPVPLLNAFGGVITNTWVLVDLGMVTIPKLRLQPQFWDGNINAFSTVATDTIYFDWVMLVPVNEGNGVVTQQVAGGDAFDISSTDALVSVGASKWYTVISYEGDRLSLPIAGVEGRTLRVVALLDGTGSPPNPEVIPSSPDADTGVLTYTPRYLVVPAP